jgi:myosin heavy subunit
MRTERRRFLIVRDAAIRIQSWWRAQVARRQYNNICRAVSLLQKHARGFLARKLASQRRAALTVIQQRVRAHLAMRRARTAFLLQCRVILLLQTACRGYLARQRHNRLLLDAEYREEMRRRAAAEEESRRQQAAVVLVRAVRRYLVRRRVVKRVWASTVIQKFWRGYRFRLEMREKWRSLTEQLGEIRERLSLANAAAKPEDR